MKSCCRLFIFFIIRLVFDVECMLEPQFVNCYSKNVNKTPLEVINSNVSVVKCSEDCSARYYRYAGLMNGTQCFCANTPQVFGQISKHACNISCSDNVSQTCGGEGTYSVYDTGQSVIGPPSSLNVTNITETSIQLLWLPPIAKSNSISEYGINVSVLRTYASSNLIPVSLPYLKVSSNKAVLESLHPSTEYNVSVAAIVDNSPSASASIIVRTRVGDPDEPSEPEVIGHGKGQLKVRLNKGENENGPITAYRIVVIENSRYSILDKTLLKSFSEAKQEGLPYYIAAEIAPDDLMEEFIVGDNRTYRSYYNAPLPDGVDIHISLGVVSTFGGETRVTYSITSHRQHNIPIVNVGAEIITDRSASPKLVTALSAAIGVFGFLLLLSVIAYFVLRRQLGRRRRTLDHQELSLQGPMIEVESNSYIHNGFVPEAEDEPPNHYEILKQKIWNIPRNFLDVQSDTLGWGQYSDVVKGTVRQRGFPIGVMIQAIDDALLDEEKKRNMLKDLDVLIRVGSHSNVVKLVGLCENPETLFIVVELHPATLKDVLLESRCLEHSSSTQQRICSLSETSILEIAIGVARGMEHLTHKKILHKHLCARNILMADGITPKISGFGIAQCTKKNFVPDYTRWTAQEIFRSRHFVSKSDVWSLGVVLWEIAALGATPLADVSTADVPSRVMRGYRLPQLRVVGDDLYQLMLHCWQLDLDERPTFSEIVNILQNLAENSLVHLNFAVYSGFHYEQYCPELEKTT